ncbi:lipase [Hymenopellis radicata]|nr:lipase [Hymenopellis radicata]
MLGAVFAYLFWGALAHATPTPRQSITQLSAAQIDAFAPYTYFAALLANCNANSDFIPVASGGDGSDVQFWYAGYSPSLASVVVAHQGTNPSEIEALLTDGNLVFDSLDSDLFPGISSDIQVHAGFASTQAQTAEAILAAVTTALSDNGADSVTLIGHSLGAALSLLDAMYLPLHLPNPTYRFVGYGLPRVGNQAFADYMDGTYGTQLTHVNNKCDPVPILPGRGLGYHQPSGEVHIDDSDAWNSCPGQDNTDEACTTGAVPNIFAGDLGDHSGPFDGIVTRC